MRDQIAERYVQEAINVLTPLNEQITRTSKAKIEDIVSEALNRELSIDEFREMIKELFTNWKVKRIHGVSVFNVTHPFNSALFQAYKANQIEFKMWVNQEMIGNFEGDLRLSHAAAGGQVVGINERFTVGAASLLYPGDLSQIANNPEELHGCRCMIKPVLDPNFPNV